jgi:hypothetical protein
MIAWEIWQQRNEAEHKDDLDKELTKIKNEIETELAIGPQNIPGIGQWFTENELTKLQGNNPHYMSAWLRNVRAQRRWSTRQEGSTEMQGMRRHLQRFLHGNIGN